MISKYFQIVFITAAMAIVVVQTATAQAANAKASSKFDGHWSVVLVCDDVVNNKGALVKGYIYKFPVVVKQGRLEGQYGTLNAPASLQYFGMIQEDGTVEITATGRTGHPEYTVGRVAKDTSYGYTMRGNFKESSGSAVRTELRPCKATFSKQ